MISFCIKNNNSVIVNYLYNSISLLNIDDIILTQKDFSKYKNIIIHYIGKNSNEFYNELANVICECIIKYYEPLLIKNALRSNYFYFDLEDIKIIEQNCNKFTKNLSEDFDDKRICLWSDILKYIINNKSMILDRFCLF